MIQMKPRAFQISSRVLKACSMSLHEAQDSTTPPQVVKAMMRHHSAGWADQTLRAVPLILAVALLKAYTVLVTRLRVPSTTPAAMRSGAPLLAPSTSPEAGLARKDHTPSPRW